MRSDELIDKLLDEICAFDLELAQVMGMKDLPDRGDQRHRDMIIITGLLGERERCRAAVRNERARRAATAN